MLVSSLVVSASSSVCVCGFELRVCSVVLLLLSLLLQAAVDVALGDSAVLSRQHCRITYNFQTKKWQLVVEVGETRGHVHWRPQCCHDGCHSAATVLPCMPGRGRGSGVCDSLAIAGCVTTMYSVTLCVRLTPAP